MRSLASGRVVYRSFINPTKPDRVVLRTIRSSTPDSTVTASRVASIVAVVFLHCRGRMNGHAHCRQTSFASSRVRTFRGERVNLRTIRQKMACQPLAKNLDVLDLICLAGEGIDRVLHRVRRQTQAVIALVYGYRQNRPSRAILIVRFCIS